MNLCARSEDRARVGIRGREPSVRPPASSIRRVTTELQILAATVILGLVHLIADSHLISWQLGYRWTAGNASGPCHRCAASRAASTSFNTALTGLVLLLIALLK